MLKIISLLLVNFLLSACTIHLNHIDNSVRSNSASMPVATEPVTIHAGACEQFVLPEMKNSADINYAKYSELKDSNSKIHFLLQYIEDLKTNVSEIKNNIKQAYIDHIKQCND